MWNLGSHDGSWEAMMGLRWWPVESRVDLGKLEMLESHDASPFTLSMASKLSSWCFYKYVLKRQIWKRRKGKWAFSTLVYLLVKVSYCQRFVLFWFVSLTEQLDRFSLFWDLFWFSWKVLQHQLWIIHFHYNEFSGTYFEYSGLFFNFLSAYFIPIVISLVAETLAWQSVFQVLISASSFSFWVSVFNVSQIHAAMWVDCSKYSCKTLS